MTNSPWPSPFQCFSPLDENAETLLSQDGYELDDGRRSMEEDFYLPDALHSGRIASEGYWESQRPAGDTSVEWTEADKPRFQLTGLDEFQRSLTDFLKSSPQSFPAHNQDTTSTISGEFSRTVSGDHSSTAWTVEEGHSPESELSSEEATTPCAMKTANVLSAVGQSSESECSNKEPTNRCDEKTANVLSAEVASEEPKIEIKPAARPYQLKSANVCNAWSHEAPEPVPNTTCLLKNVPARCTPELLIARLADYGLKSDVDFLYMPIDLKSKAAQTMGLATINFKTEGACERFKQTFSKKSAKEAFPGVGTPRKICEVSLAPVQGKSANIAKLQQSSLLMSLLADKPEGLPRVFNDEGQPVDFDQC